jgi:hypothetical protein
MNYLIPYIHLIPPDPAFAEYTYGEGGRRAHQLKENVKKGDYLFFHTSKGGKKYITAYYVVDRILDTIKIVQEELVPLNKFHNPHLDEYRQGKITQDEVNVIVFGDPILSYILPKPLPFNQELSNKLSLNIRFPANASETQAIGRATRAWRCLSKNNVDTLIAEIKHFEDNQPTIMPLMSSEEVAETLERDIEDYLANNPQLIGKNLTLVGPQWEIASGRIDLLFKDDCENWIVVEVKLNRIGRDALRQVKGYVDDLAKIKGHRKIEGVLVCSGIMPAYEDEILIQREIKVLIYGWELKVQTIH